MRSNGRVGPLIGAEMIQDLDLTVGNVIFAISYKCLALLLRYWPTFSVLIVEIKILT
jgi:hypothetical protein